MKTIKELNQKIWYRFLKVIYIAFFAIIFIFGIGLIWAGTSYYQDDYLVKCNYGNKSSFLAYKDKGIYIRSYDLGSLSDDTKKELQSTCGFIGKDVLMNEISSGTFNYNQKLYDLTSTKVAQMSLLEAIFWSIIFILIWFITCEGIKRSFYYIVLGRLRPDKE